MENRRLEAQDEIDLSKIAMGLWRRKWMILVGVTCLTFSALVVSYLLRVYESKAILRLSGGKHTVFVSDYKKLSGSFSPSAFLSHLQTQGSLEASYLKQLKKQLVLQDDLADEIKPIFAYGNQEIERSVGQFDPQKQYIVALEIQYKMSSPKAAQGVVKALVNFVKQSIQQQLLSAYVTLGKKESLEQLLSLKNELANLRFSLRQQKEKLKELKKISQRFPEAERLFKWEVVSVDKGGYLFLPPSSQMVATSVSIADTKLAIEAKERQLKIAQIKFQFYSKASKLLQKIDKDILSALEELNRTFFEAQKNEEEDAPRPCVEVVLQPPGGQTLRRE